MMHNTINCNGRLLDLSTPRVMGILNITPDSFYTGSRHQLNEQLIKSAEQMLLEGASILDIGGMSTRPGSEPVSESEEMHRVLPVIESIGKYFPEAILSIDTYRANVAKEACHAGAHIVNDISAGSLDESMFETVAALKVPYILMHMKGTPADMQVDPQYEDVNREVMQFFIGRIAKLRSLGLKDIIIDPGFGFGKNLEHNHSLLKHMGDLQILECPLLAGLSRKSMVCRLLNISAAEGLNGTTALNMIALQNGAAILRVHDVKEAMEVIRIYSYHRSI